MLAAHRAVAADQKDLAAPGGGDISLRLGLPPQLDELGDNEGQNRGGTSDDAHVVVCVSHHNSVLVPGHVPLPHRDRVQRQGHTHVVVAKPLQVSDQLAV